MYRTQEVADLHNITKKALLYYDRIGLFSPEYINEANNYRYYFRAQFPKLKQIIYLKKIGFSLEKIKHLLNNMNFDTYIELLSERLGEVSTQLAELTDIKESIEYVRHFYTHAKHISDKDLYLPMVKMFPPRKICYQMTENPSTREEIMLAYRKVLRYLDSNNMFSHKEYGTIYLKEGFMDSINQHSGAFITVDFDQMYPNEKTLPSGKYITMYKRGGYYDEENLAKFLTWISDRGYVIDGNVLDFCIVDFNFVQDENLMIQELQVKVR